VSWKQRCWKQAAQGRAGDGDEQANAAKCHKMRLWDDAVFAAVRLNHVPVSISPASAVCAQHPAQQIEPESSVKKASLHCEALAPEQTNDYHELLASVTLLV
jgi:hypothetical protein